MGVLVSDDRERRPDGFEQGLSAAGLGLAQEAYTVEPTSYLAFSRKFGFPVCVRTSRISAILVNVLHTKSVGSQPQPKQHEKGTDRGKGSLPRKCDLRVMSPTS